MNKNKNNLLTDMMFAFKFSNTKNEQRLFD